MFVKLKACHPESVSRRTEDLQLLLESEFTNKCRSFAAAQDDRLPNFHLDEYVGLSAMHSPAGQEARSVR